MARTRTNIADARKRNYIWAEPFVSSQTRHGSGYTVSYLSPRIASASVQRCSPTELELSSVVARDDFGIRASGRDSLQTKNKKHAHGCVGIVKLELRLAFVAFSGYGLAQRGHCSISSWREKGECNRGCDKRCSKGVTGDSPKE